MDQQEEFDFALNEAAIYFEGTDLKLAYGDGIVLTVEMDEQKAALTKQVMATGDFWTAFLGGLSNAVDKVASSE